MTELESQLISRIDQLETELSVLMAKIDQLFMRPRMPYTQNAQDGDFCRLDSLKKPQWTDS